MPSKNKVAAESTVATATSPSETTPPTPPGAARRAAAERRSVDRQAVLAPRLRVLLSEIADRVRDDDADEYYPPASPARDAADRLIVCVSGLATTLDLVALARTLFDRAAHMSAPRWTSVDWRTNRYPRLDAGGVDMVAMYARLGSECLDLASAFGRRLGAPTECQTITTVRLCDGEEA